MRAQGRSEGERAPKRDGAEGRPARPKGRLEAEQAPERDGAEGCPVSALAAFQDAFGAALLADDPAEASRHTPLAQHPAFAVYRNTVTRGLVDAIVANHPALAPLVGEEWLRAAAAVYARAHPPADPSLMNYGESFATFLATFPPAAGFRWLVPVARVERAWAEAHLACDEPPLDPSAVASVPIAELADARLVPHAAARWIASDDAPVHTLWSRSRRGESDLSDVAWRGEGVLVTRPSDAVRVVAIDRATTAFLDACAAGGTVAHAASAALAVDAAAALDRTMACLLDAGAFTRLEAGAASRTD